VAKQQQSDVDVAPMTEPTGKGRPTPSRREKEAARKRPLVSGDRAEQRRAMQTERERQRIGMAAGEERYLPIRDKGPQKKFARDYVDARFSVGELLIPIMVVVIIFTFFNSTAQLIGMLLLYVFFGAAIIDAIILGTILTRKLQAKYGDRAERVRWYAAMRSFQLRRMRLPKPQVKRGAYPTL
jgi:hypothetical protein